MPRRGENIYKRRDGRWEGRIQKPNGKYQYVYAKTYKEVKKKKKIFQDCVKETAKKRLYEVPCASELFESWLEGGVFDRVKPSTYESYYRCLKNYVIPYFKGSKENQITKLSIEQFVKYIHENGALSGTYKMKIMAIFKVALKEILKDSDSYEQILNAVKMPRAKHPPVEVFSDREQRQIETEVLKMDDGRAFGVLICFYTGIRLGELCALKWGNINFETKIMSIIETVSRTKNFHGNGSKTLLAAGTPKSHHSIREIPLPDFLLEILRPLKNAGSENNYILSGSDRPIDPRTYQKLFKKILKRTGVKDRKFHAIRHTFATRMLETGVDVKTLSEILGHSSVIITLKVYAHSQMEQKIAAIGKLNSLYLMHIDVDPFAVTGSVKHA